MAKCLILFISFFKAAMKLPHPSLTRSLPHFHSDSCSKLAISSVCTSALTQKMLTLSFTVLL